MTPLTIWPMQLGVFVVQGVALGLADLLDHHLLGGLGADAADGFFGVERLRRCSVAEIEPSSRSILTTMSGFFAVVLLGGRDERRLDRLEDDFLVDVLVAMDRVDDSQHFVGIHGKPLSAVYSPAARQIKLFELSSAQSSTGVACYLPGCVPLVALSNVLMTVTLRR